MSWPLNKPHDAAGYKKVRSSDYDTGNARPNTFSVGGGGSRGASGLQLLESRRAEQNHELSILDSSVARLGELSLGISKEIDLQNRMLDELQEDTERAQTHADLITKQTQDLIKKAGGPRTFCFIAALTCIFVVLALLVIYT